MALQGTEAVAAVYNALQSLRGRWFEMVHEGRDPNLTRLLRDLSDQHARQSSEIAVMLSDISASAGVSALRDRAGCCGATPSLPESPDRTTTDIFPGLITAEQSLLGAYDTAIRQQDARSPLLSMLKRHRAAIATLLQRIEALDR